MISGAISPIGDVIFELWCLSDRQMRLVLIDCNEGRREFRGALGSDASLARLGQKPKSGLGWSQ